MTSGEELIKDLTERIDRGVAMLGKDINEVDIGAERARLRGKIEGLNLVKDWLRSYPTDVRKPAGGGT